MATQTSWFQSLYSCCSSKQNAHSCWSSKQLLKATGTRRGIAFFCFDIIHPPFTHTHTAQVTEFFCIIIPPSSLTHTTQVTVCSDPPTIPNGARTWTAGEPAPVGTTVDYACDSGHELDGTAVITCDVNGNWTSPPTCSGAYILSSLSLLLRCQGDTRVDFRLVHWDIILTPLHFSITHCSKTHCWLLTN